MLWTAPIAGQDVIESGPLLTQPSAAQSAAPLNLHLVFSEELLNQLIARDEIQTGEVHDQFEDTPIAGSQISFTNLRVDLRPSAAGANLLMVLNGDTASSTAGFSPQAVVSSVAHQTFRATKEILFDGYQLATRRAEVLVLCTDQQNLGAHTPFTGSPLGPLAEQVVLGIAQQRQPAAEAFARRRVVERIYPRFNGEIDDQLGRANQLLKETVQARLKLAQLMPERMQVRTTDQHLFLSASIAPPLEVGTLPPAPDELVAPHGVAIYLHESLMQGVVERAGVAGRKVKHGVLFQLMRDIGLTVDEPPPLTGNDRMQIEIEFVDVDPLEIRVGEDETRVTLRASFKPAGQNLLPPLEVVIPYRLEADGELWELKNGPVAVRSLAGNADGTSFAELTVKQVIERMLPKVSFPRQLPAAAWPAGKTPPNFTSFRSGAGWLVIGIDAATRPDGAAPALKSADGRLQRKP